MPSPFDRSMNYFGLPQIGAQTSQLSPQEAAQVGWLNAGGKTPAPVAPISEDWDDEDWKIAAMTGDPLGVKQMWETYKGQQDEQSFMEGLGKIDWKSPGSKQKIGELVAQHPRGLSNEGLNYMRIMDSLMEPEVDKLETEAAGFGAPYLQTYQQGRATGKTPQQAYADAVSLREADELKRKPVRVTDDRLNLSGPPKEALDAIMGEYGTAMEKAMRNPTDAEKQAFLGETDGDWTKAFHLAKQQAQSELVAAQNKIQQFQSTYGQMYQMPGAIPSSASTIQFPASLASPSAAVVPQIPAESASTQPAAVIEQPAVPKTVPEELWKEFEDLDLIRSANTETPQDELTQETMKLISQDSKAFNAKRKEIMDTLGLPQSPKGLQVFEDVLRARNRATQIRQPGVTATGKAWKILPKKA